MQNILDKKNEIKNKMEEFIINFYWLKGTHIRFKDIKEKFHLYCSEGSISNYLTELQNEKKINKWYENNTAYYSAPKKHVTTIYFIIFTLCLPFYAVPLYIFFNESFLALSFYTGGITTILFWRILKTKKNNLQ